MKNLSPEKFISDACTKLASPEYEQTFRDLSEFIDFWGLDAYTHPDNVKKSVREIVNAFVTTARIIRRNNVEFEREFSDN